MPSILRAAILVFVGLNLIVFLVRAVSVLRFGSLFGTTGGECMMIYSVWKAMHGHAIYEWPLARPYSLSLYNYLFYFFYAVSLRLGGWWDAQILTYGRMLTAAFAALGAMVQWKLVAAKLTSRSQKYWCLLLCTALWFSTSFVRWWALTIRPDIPALALVMLGLLCLIKIGSHRGTLLAAICFYLAWSFKQSIAMTAAACILYLFFVRRRSAFMLLAVLATAVATTYWLGSSAYRYSVFVAPGVVSAFSLRNAVHSLQQPLMAGSYIWLPLLASLASPWKRDFDAKSLLRVSAVVGLIGGAAAMAKGGAADNYLFEAFASATTLLLIELFENPTRRVAALLVALGCIQPAVQIGSQLLHKRQFGVLEIATLGEFDAAISLQHRIQALPKPLLTSDEIFSLPWNSSDNSYPAYVIDPVFEFAAGKRYVDGGPVTLVENQHVPSLMLRPDDLDLRRALVGKYHKVGDEVHQNFHYEVFVRNQAPAKK